MIKVEKRNSTWILWMDRPDKKVNLLNKEFMNNLDKIVSEISKVETVKGVIFISKKEDNFIAGADLELIGSCRSKEDATNISLQGQRLFKKIFDLNATTVAAINGNCLGGGLELALACDFRIASNSKNTKLGLPEVQLGILPGGGGTLRLPQIIDLQKALEMLLTGKSVTYEDAKINGLVDEVVHPNILLDIALKWASLKRRSFKYNRGVKATIETSPLVRNFIINQAKKRNRKKTHNLYPAPKKILEVVSESLSKNEEDAMKAEREAFADLVMTREAQNLIWLFNADQEIKRENKERVKNIESRIQRMGVIGAGLMGAGISYISSFKANKAVRLKDLEEDNLAEALDNISSMFKFQRRNKNISRFEMTRMMNRITITTNYTGFEKMGLIIEAVFENKDLKKKIYKEIEDINNYSPVIATNTSTIPLSELGENLRKPENLIGMHYFSPVEKMPLIEIIKSIKTDEEVLAKAIWLGMKQGKKIIIVNDSCGFFTSRVLAFYLAEAVYCLREGFSVEDIDSALIEYGFPMGPFEVIDSVGIKVTTDIVSIVQSHFSDRFNLPIDFSALIDKNIKGKKTGSGFYIYKNGKKKVINKSIYKLLNLKPKKTGKTGRSKIAKRCLYKFCLESIRTLEEGILYSARDGDFASIYGLGFPAFTGGPFHLIDAIGISRFISDLNELQELGFSDFIPPNLLKRMAKKGEFFTTTSSKAENNYIEALKSA